MVRISRHKQSYVVHIKFLMTAATVTKMTLKPCWKVGSTHKYPIIRLFAPFGHIFPVAVVQVLVRRVFRHSFVRRGLLGRSPRSVVAHYIPPISIIILNPAPHNPLMDAYKLNFNSEQVDILAPCQRRGLGMSVRDLKVVLWVRVRSKKGSDEKCWCYGMLGMIGSG